MERWVKYNNVRLNMGVVKHFRVFKADKGSLAYPDDMVTKDKMWVLSVDHFDIAAFATKAEATAVVDAIIKGEHDCK